MNCNNVLCNDYEREAERQLDKLRAEIAALKDRYETCEVCEKSTESGVVCVRCYNDALAKSDLQVEAWKKYHALLRDDLHSAVGLAWIHGWRSTPENIEMGQKLRRELGIPDVHARESEKRKPEADGNPWTPNKDYPGKPIS